MNDCRNPSFSLTVVKICLSVQSLPSLYSDRDFLFSSFFVFLGDGD